MCLYQECAPTLSKGLGSASLDCVSIPNSTGARACARARPRAGLDARGAARAMRVCGWRARARAAGAGRRELAQPVCVVQASAARPAHATPRAVVPFPIVTTSTRRRPCRARRRRKPPGGRRHPSSSSPLAAGAGGRRAASASRWRRGRAEGRHAVHQFGLGGRGIVARGSCLSAARRSPWPRAPGAVVGAARVREEREDGIAVDEELENRRDRSSDRSQCRPFGSTRWRSNASTRSTCSTAARGLSTCPAHAGLDHARERAALCQQRTLVCS